MRSSKYGDHWKKVRGGKSYQVGVSTLLVSDEKSGEKIQFNLSGNTAICGANGSGKSTLLKLLSSNRNVDVASLSLAQSIEWRKITEDATSVTYLSPPESIASLLADISDTLPSEVDERIEFLAAYSEGKFSKDGLEQINYALATNIEQITIYEIERVASTSLSAYDAQEAIPEKEETFPYFRVSRDGDEIFSDNLSSGELYVIYLYWFLSTKLEVPVAVLIDEPESFLCPRSQYRLADVLAYLSSERCIQLIFATHSHCFVEMVGIQSTLLSHISQRQINIIKPMHASQSFHSLGYEFREDKWILLEDTGAARFFNNLFKAINLHWLRDRKLIPLKGESDITEILKRVPEWLDLIGVYDGDQRGKVVKEVSVNRYKILPGNEPPEVLLINHIKPRHAEYAQKIGIRADYVESAMQKLRGVDHHDFFCNLSRELEFDLDVGRGAEKLFDDAFHLWISDIANRKTAYEFVVEFDPSFKGAS